MSSGGEKKRVVVWLRNDLRVHDNPVLNGAANLVRKGAAEEVCFYSISHNMYITSLFAVFPNTMILLPINGIHVEVKQEETLGLTLCFTLYCVQIGVMYGKVLMHC